jgi:hypothetical protein
MAGPVKSLIVPEVVIRPPDSYHMDRLTYTDGVAKASARSGFSHVGARPTSRKRETASMNVPEYVMGFSLVAI